MIIIGVNRGVEQETFVLYPDRGGEKNIRSISSKVERTRAFGGGSWTIGSASSRPRATLTFHHRNYL